MPSGGNKLGTWFLVAVLLALLALAIYVAVSGWEKGAGGTDVSTAGYVAMALGILATLALGIGLMVLMFRSRDGE
jgi:hypothetical protein